MSVLAPTPGDRLVNERGQPYFLWDEEMTIDQFRELVRDPDSVVRAYFVGKLMRQAKPDDVFTFVSLREIHELYPALEKYLGRTRAFWVWLLERWRPDRATW